MPTFRRNLQNVKFSKRLRCVESFVRRALGFRVAVVVEFSKHKQVVVAGDSPALAARWRDGAVPPERTCPSQNKSNRKTESENCQTNNQRHGISVWTAKRGRPGKAALRPRSFEAEHIQNKLEINGHSAYTVYFL